MNQSEKQPGIHFAVPRLLYIITIEQEAVYLKFDKAQLIQLHQ